MILDLRRFVLKESPYWKELEARLGALESDVGRTLELAEALRLHYLYERASADLVTLQTYTAEPESRRYLESLVARAYGEIHETRASRRFFFARWFFGSFPRTFRRRFAAFALAAGVLLAGSLFGGVALAVDPEAKAALIPFGALQGSPQERVRREESVRNEEEQRLQATFAASLMTHNIKVSLLCLSLGMTWGVGTILLLFYNGVLLGAVVVDYLLGGEAAFVAGWLLPHGAIEIPAVLIGGQAGLVLAGALLSRGRRAPFGARLRAVLPDVVTLAAGMGVLLIWAGLVESFLSQLHEPVLPYALKIGFGAAEILLLVSFLALSGRGRKLDEA